MACQSLRGVLLFIGAATVVATAAATAPDDLALNKLIASYSAVPDPLHWLSFYSLPRTVAAAQSDAWSRVVDAAPPSSLAALPGVEALVSTWCRHDDYRVCLVYDAAGVVAGLQVSISVKDFEQSNKLQRYPIELETQWRRQNVLGTEVYSATAFFVPVRVISDGGRSNFTDADDTLEGLFLENGKALWAMPGDAQGAADVAYSKQGCVEGMGRHFFYNMYSQMACEDHRPFFLLFDDVTGRLHGFGVTLFGKTSHSWHRWWLEAPRKSALKAMLPDAPQCFQDWCQESGLISLHVYFRPSPWRAQCSEHNTQLNQL